MPAPVKHSTVDDTTANKSNVQGSGDCIVVTLVIEHSLCQKHDGSSQL